MALISFDKLNKLYTIENIDKLHEEFIYLTNYFEIDFPFESFICWIPNGTKHLILTTDALYSITFFKEKSKLNNYLLIPISIILKCFYIHTSFGDNFILDCSDKTNENIITINILINNEETINKFIELINNTINDKSFDSSLSLFKYANKTKETIDFNSISIVNVPGRKGAIKAIYKTELNWFSKTYEEKINNNDTTSEYALSDKEKEEVNFCPNCGAKIEQGNRFCSNCGNEITNIKTDSRKQNNDIPASFYKPKELSAKKLHKINKKQGIVSCPKCGSTSITTTNKKVSVGKGVAGAAVGSLINPIGTVVGAAVGATHSKKIYNVCMNCGHRWKP